MAVAKSDYLWENDGEKCIVHIESEENIIACILKLFGDVLNRSEGTRCIRLVMQPSHTSVQKLIQPFFQDSGIKIEQIVCLEQSFPKSYLNLDIFRQLLPLCFERIQYEARYYYDFLAHHINSMSWMPNILLIGDAVLQFDYDMKHGILVRDNEYLESVEKEYIKMYQQSLPFLVSGAGINNAMQFYEKTMPGKGEMLFSQPCFGYCISTDIYEKFLFSLPEKNMLIERMAQVNGDWDVMTFLPPPEQQKGCMRSYCQESGIRRFMKTGRVEEFPLGFYKPLDKETRHRILERLIWLLETGYIDCCLLPEDIPIPKDIYFYWDDVKKRLSLCLVGADGFSQVLVEEQGIYRTFKCFFEYMEKKGLIQGREKVLELLEKIRCEYW